MNGVRLADDDAIEHLYKELPSEFTTRRAVKDGARLNIPEWKVHLKLLKNHPKTKRVVRGHYVKREKE